MMNKLFIPAILLSVLVGCSPVGIASKLIPSLVGDKPGISAEARIAKEANDSVVVGENKKTDIKAETVTISEVVHKNFSMSLLIFAIAGWILPTPARMGKWIWAKIWRKK